MDHSVVRAASRRAGLRFKLHTSSRTGPRYVHHGQPKVTRALVAEMRQWAARDGWGLTRADQIVLLSQRYPLKPQSFVEILTNMAWFDPAYVPGRPDADFWGTASVTAIALRVLGRSA